jgi:hypothetical protein
MLIVANWTARMPPHIVRVFMYQSGKSPLFHAMAKGSNPNGPAGVSEAISVGTPGATSHRHPRKRQPPQQGRGADAE